MGLRGRFFSFDLAAPGRDARLTTAGIAQGDLGAWYTPCLRR